MQSNKQHNNLYVQGLHYDNVNYSLNRCFGRTNNFLEAHATARCVYIQT